MDAKTRYTVCEFVRNELAGLGLKDVKCDITKRGVDYFVTVVIELRNVHHYEYGMTVNDIWNCNWYPGKREYAKKLAGAIQASLIEKNAIPKPNNEPCD